ncbi:MAG: MalY/PatB family protein [Bacteroidales bacterium]
MKTFDFDQPVDRENTSCVKYDLRQLVFMNSDVTPMWVADMDIPTPDFIVEAIKDRCNHPFLGYTFRDGSYNNAIVEWYAKRHSWVIQPTWIEFCPGVVSGLNHAIRAFTNPGDKIIIQPPVYHPFFSTVQNNHGALLLNPLVEQSGHYAINFENLEKLMSQGARMLILSSPHNPVGKVWSKEELVRVGELCSKYNVLLIADEIHSDLVYKPNKHVPLASIDEKFAQNTVTFSSASKTFNIAGLSSGFVIIPNPDLLKLYRQELEASGAGMGNIFGNESVKAALSNRGAAWLDELLDYLEGNINLAEDTLRQFLPKVKFARPQGTYLLWLDFREFKMDEKTLNDTLINRVGLGLNAGSEFGKEGEGFQRMNIACPRSAVKQALDKLILHFKGI